VKFKPVCALAILQRNLLIYGVGGIIIPFVGIKVIDVLITMFKLI
jgi:K+-transporting ATPase ATPase B chain